MTNHKPINQLVAFDSRKYDVILLGFLVGRNMWCGADIWPLFLFAKLVSLIM